MHLQTCTGREGGGSLYNPHLECPTLTSPPRVQDCFTPVIRSLQRHCPSLTHLLSGMKVSASHCSAEVSRGEEEVEPLQLPGTGCPSGCWCGPHEGFLSGCLRDVVSPLGHCPTPGSHSLLAREPLVVISKLHYEDWIERVSQQARHLLPGLMT